MVQNSVTFMAVAMWPPPPPNHGLDLKKLNGQKKSHACVQGGKWPPQEINWNYAKIRKY